MGNKRAFHFKLERTQPTSLPKLGFYVMFFSFFLLLSFPKIGFAQKISLNLKNATIFETLDNIQKQIKINVVADFNQLKNSSKISIHIEKKELSVVLQELNRISNFTFELELGTIYIQEKKQSLAKEKQQSQNSIPPKKLISGIVQNELREILAGVTIRNQKHPKLTTISDNNGKFEITYVDQFNDILMFSNIGYETKYSSINPNQSLKIILKKKNNDLETVTINTGYTNRKWNYFTGTSTSFSSKDIANIQHPNIFKLLQSLDPSIRIDENVYQGSNPNFVPQITVRGINNVGNYVLNSPLFILDGFEVGLELLFDIDINRIQTITLLKDASSTVLYGSRGGNTVIVVETKKPIEGKVSISFDNRNILEKANLSYYQLMNTQEKLQFEVLAGNYHVKRTEGMSEENYQKKQVFLDQLYEQRKSDLLAGVNTDWLIQPIQERISSQNSIRFEGGKNGFSFSLDGNLSNQHGLMKFSGRDRKNSSLNLIYRKNKNLTIRSISNLFTNTARHTSYGNLQDYAIMNPYQKLKDKDSLIREFPNEQIPETKYNPLYNALLPFKNEEKTRFFMQSIYIDWRLNPHFTSRTTFNYDQKWNNLAHYVSPNHSKYLADDADAKGELTQAKGNGNSFTVNTNFGYRREIGENYINLNLISEYRQSKYLRNEDRFKGIKETNNIPNDSIGLKPLSVEKNINGLKSKLLSYIFSGNYAYKQKYQVDFSYRIDGSSKFGSNNPYGNFWTIGLGYDLKKEFLTDTKWVDFLRVFGNTGVTGTDAFLSNMTLNSFINPEEQLYYDELGKLYDNEGNPNLKWPLIKSWNIGFTSRLFENRVSFSLSAYRKNTDRMISLITAAPSLGLPQESYYENAGSVQNQGFESNISFKLFNRPSSGFSADLNITLNKNQSKLIQISEELEYLNKGNIRLDNFGNPTQSSFYQQGESITNLKGMKSLGIDPISGKEFYLNKSGQITDLWEQSEITVIGNTEPFAFGAINSSVSMKSFSLYAFFNYSISGDVYNLTKMNRVENINTWMNTDKSVLSNRWTLPGDISDIRPVLSNEKSYLTDRFIEKENILRLSSLSLNYQINLSLIEKYKLKSLKIQATANDLFTLSNVKMERGIYYPYSKSFVLGVFAQF